jgi:hypothetical protein
MKLFYTRGMYQRDVQRIANALDKENVSHKKFLEVLPTFLAVIYASEPHKLHKYLESTEAATSRIIHAAQRAGTAPAAAVSEEIESENPVQLFYNELNALVQRKHNENLANVLSMDDNQNFKDMLKRYEIKEGV